MQVVGGCNTKGLQMKESGRQIAASTKPLDSGSAARCLVGHKILLFCSVPFFEGLSLQNQAERPGYLLEGSYGWRLSATIGGGHSVGAFIRMLAIAVLRHGNEGEVKKYEY